MTTTCTHDMTKTHSPLCGPGATAAVQMNQCLYRSVREEGGATIQTTGGAGGLGGLSNNKTESGK